MEFFVGGKYRLSRKIGSGSYGVVYVGTNIYTEEHVAVKLEYQTAVNPKLASEYKIYKILAGGAGIPSVHWFGKAGKYNALVLDLLGPSLHDLFRFCGSKFTLKTVLMLADKLLARVEYIHSKNLIHLDIKPSNFTMGLDKRQLNEVYLIDFGLAKWYNDSDTSQHGTCNKYRSLTGTARYASVNAHLGMEQSRRDDLESLGYTLIYFALGSLPWQSFKAKTKKKFYNMIMEKKITTPAEILCRSLPTEFATYIRYCWSLDFNEKPEYSFLRHLFRGLYIQMGYSDDYQFDWTILNNKSSSNSKKITADRYKEYSMGHPYNSNSTRFSPLAGTPTNRYTRFFASKVNWSATVFVWMPVHFKPVRK